MITVYYDRLVVNTGKIKFDMMNREHDTKIYCTDPFYRFSGQIFWWPLYATTLWEQKEVDTKMDGSYFAANGFNQKSPNCRFWSIKSYKLLFLGGYTNNEGPLSVTITNLSSIRTKLDCRRLPIVKIWMTELYNNNDYSGVRATTW